MEHEERNVGRAYLVAELRKRGVSRRLAVRILNLVFREMSQALARGKEVEFPFGKLRRVRRHFSADWDRADDWPANRQGYTVEWELNRAGMRVASQGSAEVAAGEGPDRASGTLHSDAIGLVSKLRVSEKRSENLILQRALCPPKRHSTGK